MKRYKAPVLPHLNVRDASTVELAQAFLGKSDVKLSSITGAMRGDVKPGDDDGQRLLLAIELGRRAIEASVGRESMSNPARIAAWAKARLHGLAHEELWLLCLDSHHGLLCSTMISRGGSSGAATSVRDVIRAVLASGAVAFALVHNHPSGNPAPSPEDVQMTREIRKGAEVMGLTLADHVVYGGSLLIDPKGYRSFYEQGLL